MTQAELAKRLGVPRQTVIAIEQGKHSPSLRSERRRPCPARRTGPRYSATIQRNDSAKLTTRGP
ncbi:MULTISPECIES: helix-turn-helix transcriptional regulator [unclassified Micromonospora]|uniref:helix-turn-helix transcriptional regulator n=1 Tax=unclassified Micromonospora TaxID=2617518 RepID=UPI003A86088D